MTLGSLSASFEPWRRLGPVPTCYFLNVTYKVGRRLKGPAFQFFRHCETFLEKFSVFHNGPPLIFCGTMRLFEILIFRFFFGRFYCLQRVLFHFLNYFATNWMFKKSKGSLILHFRPFENSHFSSEINIFQFISTNFFSTLCEILRYIRTILSGKNEAEVRKQANPFLPAQNLWVFRHFHVSF